MLTTLVAQGIADVLGNVTISPNGPINPTSATSGQNPPWTPNAGSVLIGTLSIPGADANSQWNLLVNGLVIITFAAYGATINDFEVIQGQTITLSGTGLTAGKTYSVVYLAVASDANLTPDTVPYLSSNGNVSVTGSVTIPGTVTLGASSNVIGAISSIGAPIAIGPGSSAIGSVVVSGTVSISSGNVTIGAISGGVIMPVSGFVSATVSGSVSISSGTVSISGTPAVTISSGNVTVSGSVNVGTISGTVTIQGAVTISSGSVSISGTPAVTITSGTVTIGAGANTIGTVNLAGGSTVIIGAGTANIGTIGIAAGASVALGPGTSAIGTVALASGSQVVIGAGSSTIGTVDIASGSQVNIENVSGTGISVENLSDTYLGTSTQQFLAVSAASVTQTDTTPTTQTWDFSGFTYPTGLSEVNFHSATVIINLTSYTYNTPITVSLLDTNGLTVYDESTTFNTLNTLTGKCFTFVAPMTVGSSSGCSIQLTLDAPALAGHTNTVSVDIILDQEPNVESVWIAGVINDALPISGQIATGVVAGTSPTTGQVTVGTTQTNVAGVNPNRTGLTIHSLSTNTEPVYLATGPPNTGGGTITASGSGTWVCPAGITSIKVECWAGGGGSGGGGGAGGGEYAAEATLAVTPGTTYAYTVGALGIGVLATAGGDTTFTGDSVTVHAHGGSPSPSGTAAGAGGTGSSNTTHYDGGIGGSAAAPSRFGGGGGSGGPASAGNAGGAATGGGGGHSGAGATAVAGGGPGGGPLASPISGPGGGGSGDEYNGWQGQIVITIPNSVTTTNSFILEPGHDITFASPVQWFGITPASTALVCYEDE